MTWGDWPGQVGWLDMMYGMHIEGSSYLDRYGGIWRYLDLIQLGGVFGVGGGKACFLEMGLLEN